MKKLFCIVLIALTATLCACSGEPEPIPEHKAGVLYFTDTTKTYSGCATRAQQVITALNEKVNLIISQNNTAIESRVPEKYFLEQDYILTSFQPFVSDYFAYTLGFSDDAAKAGTLDVTADFGEASSTLFEKVDKNVYKFTVEGGEREFELHGEYSRKCNSLRFSRVVFDEDGESAAEFLDFVYVEDKGYYLQNAAERCVIAFDESGNVSYFTYARLAQGEFEFEAESVYPDGEEARELAPAEWTSGGDKNRYICVYAYTEGVLSYEDCSSGKWKTVNISEISD